MRVSGLQVFERKLQLQNGSHARPKFSCLTHCDFTLRELCLSCTAALKASTKRRCSDFTSPSICRMQLSKTRPAVVTTSLFTGYPSVAAKCRIMMLQVILLVCVRSY